MQGALSNGPPGERACSVRPPTKAPGKVAPFDPRPPSRSANWRICKIAISSAPSRVFTDPPPKPRLPKPREGAPAPCVHPAPRASRSAARFARRLRLHLTRRCGQLPRRANWRPTPPFPGPRSPAGRPSPRGWGGGTAGGARLRGDRRAGGSYREGHPARAPTVTSPAIPAPPTQRDAATLAGPHSLSPGPLGPGRFYTDSPTPFGV
ncbi:uncharacterized protein N7525_011633 [Penicillium rubens]|uniref:uncharacterized protein n=1 Tax=Penicillium rubens TaxID=1108849 RepID=UPI002A59B7A7|nr:uncharacterized protein N7525_011633 [Penicillium rubens]KAJ5822349.1 hypothetical protein N7525_011633 [Penicillium rubens]